MITSTKNPRIVALRKLHQRKHRLRQNRFMVEGLQLLGMALQAAASPFQRHKIAPQELFYSESLFTGDTAPQLLETFIEAGAEAIPVDERVLNTISDRDTSQGLIATFSLHDFEYTQNELQALISQSPNLPVSQSPALILILDKLQDPGNLGTLIRTADSAGVRAIILLEPCVDPFDPKTVRSTMGSIFTVPFLRATEAETSLAQISEAGYRLVGADAVRGQIVWRHQALTGSVALILGNEARGLSSELHDLIDDYVSLPLLGQAESLNVAVAGGVLMYEWLRMKEVA